MDDAYARSRYRRNNVYARRRRKTEDKKSLGEVFVRQLAICIILFIMFVVVKNLDNPLAKRATENLKRIVSYDIGIKGINDVKEIISIKGLFGTGKDAREKETDSLKDISAVNAGVFESIDDMADIEDAALNTEDTIPDEAQSIINKMSIPVQGIIETPYGEFIHPVSKDVLFHRGIDIAVQGTADTAGAEVAGVDVAATYEGVVTEIGSKTEFGNYIVLEHGGGVKTVYAHCKDISVKLEQSVKKDEKISSIAGNSALGGAHLHFEIHVNDIAIDPLRYMPADWD